MKWSAFIVSFSLLVSIANAQELLLQPKSEFDKRKTVQLYAIVQPVLHQQNFLNEQLQNYFLPETHRMNIGLGVGLEYSFQTGTSLRLETVFNQYSKEQNGTQLRVLPINYELSIKQLFFSYAKVRPYLTAGAGGWEQTIRISRQQAAPGTIQELLTTSNTVQFTKATDYFTAGLGINLQPFAEAGKRVTDFTEIELGIRTGLGQSILYNQQTDFPPLLKDVFQQYYLSFKAGLSYRRKRL